MKASFKKVLVVDDDKDILNLIELDLNSSGFNADIAMTVEDAIDSLIMNNYLCIILDIVMGVDISSEKIIQLSQKYNNSFGNQIPVIVTSSYISDEYSSSIKDKCSGIYSTVTKPFKIGTFGKIVKTIFENSFPGASSETNIELSEKLDEQNSNLSEDNKKIIVLDDDTDIVDLITLQLKSSSSITVDKAYSEDDALKLLSTNKYELGILDIVLGKNISSNHIIDHIEHNKEGVNYKLPLIVMSSYINDDYSNRIRKKSTSILETIKKPFSKNEIQDAVNRILKVKFSDNIDVQDDIKISESTDKVGSVTLKDNNDNTKEFINELNASEDLEENYHIKDSNIDGDESVIVHGSSEKVNPELYKFKESGVIESATNKVKGSKDQNLEDSSPDMMIIKGKDSDSSLGANWIKTDFKEDDNAKTVTSVLSGKKVKTKFSPKELNSSDLMSMSFAEDDVNIRNAKGETALMLLAFIGDIEKVKSLIENDASVFLKSPVGKTCLHYAARGGKLDVLEFLMNVGAKMNARDSNGLEPLADAIIAGKNEVITYLIDKGARTSCRVNGLSYLMLAQQSGHIEAVIELLKAGVSPNVIDYKGMTVLDRAKKKKQGEIVSILEMYMQNGPEALAV